MRGLRSNELVIWSPPSFATSSLLVRLMPTPLWRTTVDAER